MLMLCVRTDLDAGKIPMLLGEPGIGKSSWLENLGHLMRTSVFTLACNQLADKADLTGARLVPTANGDSYMQVFYPHATITEAIDYAENHQHETPILFLDELNRTTPDVTSELLSIPTMRSIGSKKLPRNLRVVIAGNDKGNVTTLDEASVSRFVLYHVTPDVDTFLSLDQNLNEHVKAVLEAHPDVIFCKNIEDGSDVDEDAGIDDILIDDDGMSQLTTPRTITAVSDWLNRLTTDDLRSMVSTPTSNAPDAPSVLQEAVEGHVGHTRFAALLLGQIADALTRNRSNSATLVVAKPKFFDELRASATRDEMANKISNLSESDRAAALIWALHDHSDNENVAIALASNIDRLDATDISTIYRLHMADNLDPANVSAFVKSDTEIARTISPLLS